MEIRVGVGVGVGDKSWSWSWRGRGRGRVVCGGEARPVSGGSGSCAGTRCALRHGARQSRDCFRPRSPRRPRVRDADVPEEVRARAKRPFPHGANGWGGITRTVGRSARQKRSGRFSRPKDWGNSSHFVVRPYLQAYSSFSLPCFDAGGKTESLSPLGLGSGPSGSIPARS